jgi:hypothetical protein
MASESHISDVASGNVAICGACGGANPIGSSYCRECGRRLSAAKIPVNGAKDDLAGSGRQNASRNRDTSSVNSREEARAAIYETYPSSGEASALSSTLPEPQKSPLEKLDMLERELEAKRQEPLPEPEHRGEPDKLDEHEETLKNIAFRLDALISDLLKAEAQEYSFSDSQRIDKKSFAKNSANAKRNRLKKKVSTQEVIVLIVLIALIAAIFLVGMTFGLWGTYFFGI